MPVVELACGVELCAVVELGVLAVAGIYGPSASGKSNVIDALAWLSAAVRRSLRSWEHAIPREPFRFGSAPTSPSTLEIEVLVRGIRYTYRLDVKDDQVVFEGLYGYPERRRRVLFEREGMTVSPSAAGSVGSLALGSW